VSWPPPPQAQSTKLSPKIIAGGAAGYIAAAVWVALSAGLFQLFQFYDWEEGKVRGLLLLALAMTAFAPLLLARRVRFRLQTPSWLRRLAVFGAGLLLLFHVRTGYVSARRDVRSEMGEIHYRAVRLLNRGVNPYATTTVLDSGSYGGIIQFDFVQRCSDLPRIPISLPRCSRCLDSFSSSEVIIDPPR